MLSSETGIFTFHLYNSTNRALNQRAGETKLSAEIKFGEDTKKCKYVLLGISEDIGPQMNGGFPGSKMGFNACCQALQSVQSNEYCSGGKIGILGEIVQNFNFTSIEKCVNWVAELDNFVLEVLGLHLNDSQKLIVVGGGHNNAFPLIVNASERTNQKVHAINIDPHADCRTLEFRHSGNPFSSCSATGVLANYSVFGLHEAYNNQYILDYLKSNSFHYETFETFLDDSLEYWRKWEDFVQQLPKKDTYTLDIDLDAIAFCPSSALTPSGFTVEEIRRKIRSISSLTDISVFHLPEGAPQSVTENRLYGKMVSYFIMDFIKGQESK